MPLESYTLMCFLSVLEPLDLERSTVSKRIKNCIIFVILLDTTAAAGEFSKTRRG